MAVFRQRLLNLNICQSMSDSYDNAAENFSVILNVNVSISIVIF